ncbi:hypothetical protein RFI_02536 [Reticulomyxa filosa]|uniref:Uncharacterized protein n=1 Tax=Reticulomyxa filosa TaxID=46433 RepID=X6PA80_RETFI|nr:hypothetical protein RFI_02536 [Reticulomyxa filosa]|eukprot:ETO34557.1 hypothetical protein RFI_02536 [Reticulomyxa filosa]
MILSNHTFGQLTQIAEKSQQQIKRLQAIDTSRNNTSHSPYVDDSPLVSEKGMKEEDVILASIDNDNNNEHQEQPLHLNVITCTNGNDITSLQSIDEPYNQSPTRKYWNAISRELNVKPQRRRYCKVDNPVYVPNLRNILTNDYWLDELQYYVENYQPARLKYLTF